MCEIENVIENLASDIKNSFYQALDHKHKLPELHNLFNKLIVYINDVFFVSKTLTLRSPLNESTIEVWKKIIKLITKTKNGSQTNQTEIDLIFHIMILSMGLQVFLILKWLSLVLMRF